MHGKVFFIGGGPGDPELLTLKAYKIIKKADVIIYAGSLVNEKILEFARDDAEVYNSASMTLEEIIEIIEDKAKENKIIARIHTGDPSIYGAIAEQMRELDKRGIPYEIIPGVSSLFAAAAALKVELTLPEISQTVIITRPAGRTPVPKREDIEKLAKHRATMCIFLGVHKIREIVDKLLKHYPPNTPVAVVKNASWEDETILQGTLENIVEKVENKGIKRSAIIIVGKILEAKDFKRSKLYNGDFAHGYRQ